jgi:hypothetical protein
VTGRRAPKRQVRDWKDAAAAVTEMETAWARFRAGEVAPTNVTALNGLIGTLQVVGADKELDAAAKPAGKCVSSCPGLKRPGADPQVGPNKA